MLDATTGEVEASVELTGFASSVAVFQSIEEEETVVYGFGGG